MRAPGPGGDPPLAEPLNPAHDLQPGPAMVDVADVVVGERDRVDLGDVAALAASIEGVGLLHPVVISPARQLIAGGRRLAAVRSLGWVRMPVTVAELSTVAELLRAEADENTQRKPLTGTEALAAADRRAVIYAAMAHDRMTAGVAPEPSGNLPEGGEPESRRTRTLAAVGTGFSATSLRKVAVVRDAAERQTVRHGGRDVPVPAPVREVAREALAAVAQPGAKVDRAYRQVRDALEDAAPSPAMSPAEREAVLDAHVPGEAHALARYRRAFAQAITRAGEPLRFAPTDVRAQVDGELVDAYRGLVADLAAHLDQIAAGPRLRAVSGSQQTRRANGRRP